MLETKDYIVGILLGVGFAGMCTAGFSLFLMHGFGVKQKSKVIAWICLGVFVI